MRKYEIRNGHLYLNEERLPVCRSVILLTLIRHARTTGEVCPFLGRTPISRTLAKGILRHEQMFGLRAIAAELEKEDARWQSA